jgi:perosamine synthetase
VSSYWQGKKVVVTGGAGFIGSAVVRRLISTRGVSESDVSIPRAAEYDLVALQQLAGERSLHLVEDAAQSLACRYQRAHLGTYGAAGSFSFSIHKLVGTGNGGTFVTDDEGLCQKMRLVKDFGRPTAGIDRHETLGYNFKFTDFQAVVGIEQMKKLPARAERKKAIFARYRERLSDGAGVSFLGTDLAEVTPWFMDILVEPGRRDPLAAYLKARGIGTRPFYPAIHTQPPFAEGTGAFPHSAEASARGLWLPSSPRLTDEDVDYVCEGVHDFFRIAANSGEPCD